MEAGSQDSWSRNLPDDGVQGLGGCPPTHKGAIGGRRRETVGCGELP